MAALWQNSVDFNSNQILGLVVEILSAAPSSPAMGRVYFDSTLEKLRYFNGVDWISLEASGGGVTDHGDLTGLADDDHTQYLTEARGDARYYTETEVDDALDLKANIASPTFTGTVGGITKAMVGLGNVDNTSDANKPVSTATQTALDLKANLASPTFTGTPLAPTATAGTNTTQIATTAFVQAAAAALVDSAPGTLDTLNELAAALGDDANFAATTATALGALDTRLDVVEANATGLTHKYATSVGDDSNTSFTVTHNLNTRDVVVNIYQSASVYAQVYTDVEATTVNTVTVRFSTAPTTNQYRVVVVG